MDNLYSNIKKRRLSLGMTQSELAEKTGYSDKSMIARIEKGAIDLPQSKIKLFAKALSTSPEDLFNWVGNDAKRIAENIKKRRNALKMSKKEFGLLLGYNDTNYDENYIDKLEAGLVKFDGETISTISEILKVPPFLLLGSIDDAQKYPEITSVAFGEDATIALLNSIYGYAAIRINEKNENVLWVGLDKNRIIVDEEVLEDLSALIKDTIPGLLKFLVDKNNEKHKKFKPLTTILIPHLFQNNYEDIDNFLFQGLLSDTIEIEKKEAKSADFAITIDGNSMEPTFFNGDILLVKKTDSIKVGEIGVFLDDDTCYIKEKSIEYLISHNKKYGIIPVVDTMRCVGKVIGKV